MCCIALSGQYPVKNDFPAFIQPDNGTDDCPVCVLTACYENSVFRLCSVYKWNKYLRCRKYLVFNVGVLRLERRTLCSQSRCASQLRHTPKCLRERPWNLFKADAKVWLFFYLANFFSRFHPEFGGMGADPDWNEEGCLKKEKGWITIVTQPFIILRWKGDSNPRNPLRVRQFSKLLV